MERGMGMEWFIILLIWLVAPFAELAAIIVLAVANSRYKRRIWLSLIHISEPTRPY